jgi:hypothetical protein
MKKWPGTPIYFLDSGARFGKTRWIMGKNYKGTIIALASAAALACSLQAGATTTDSLQDLVDTNGSLSIGDKVFSNFNFFESGLTNFDASQIMVTASFSGGIYYLTWAGNMSLISSGPATADLLLNYTVTATAGSIDMIDQSYTGSRQPPGGSFISIDESVRNKLGNVVASSHLDGHDHSDPIPERGDDLNITQHRRTYKVTTDIAFGLVDGGFISVSQINQSFHQTAVPEASTTTMLLTGVALLGFLTLYRRRRT